MHWFSFSPQPRFRIINEFIWPSAGLETPMLRAFKSFDTAVKLLSR